VGTVVATPEVVRDSVGTEGGAAMEGNVSVG